MRAQSERLELGERSGRPIVDHGYTFYDVGGVIEPGVSYLVALRTVEDNPVLYDLNEQNAGHSIFWGEFADDIVTQLEQLSGASAPRRNR
jgi:hypothetical protein